MLDHLRTSDIYYIATTEDKNGYAKWALYLRLSRHAGIGEDTTLYNTVGADIADNSHACDDCEAVIKNKLKAKSEAEVRIHAIFWLTEAAYLGVPEALKSLAQKSEWGLYSKEKEEASRLKIAELEERLNRPNVLRLSQEIIIGFIAWLILWFLKPYIWDSWIHMIKN